MPGTPLILASSSAIRLQLLRQAGINVTAIAPRVDEDTAKAALLAEAATPRDIADALAELKARKVADRHADALVLGCDQVLAFERRLLSKPITPEDAADQLSQLQGKTHHLLSALVLYDKGQPIWRHIGQARMTMRALTGDAIASYVARNWHSIRHSVGGYKIEEEGRALFSAIDGDDPTIQGLPLTPLIGYLRQRGFLTA